MRKALIILSLVTLVASTTLSQFRASPKAIAGPALVQEPGSSPGSPKSALIGIALSLVLPGAGEWYADNLTTGRYFMGADGALWLSYAGVSLRGKWIRNDARLFATRHAGVTMGGKDERFEVNIGNFQSTDDYNQARLREREYDLLYDKPDYLWNWDGETNRLEYKTLRIRSDQYFQNAKFVVGALIVNRIISAFSAWRSVNRYNKALETAGAWDLRAELQGGLHQQHGLAIRFTKSF